MAVDVSTPIGAPRASTAVASAIRSASQATGTSFNYLLATAKIESDLDPNLAMKSSSATGLFQFIDQTWLGTLKQAGPALGYGTYADAISKNPATGRYSVSDPAMRQEIMKLRTDPTANAMMAGVLTQQNSAALARRIGRQPSESELYMAHFFGSGGAGKLIDMVGSNPQASAAEAFPAAAHANRSIFYDRQGNARSVSGVYSELIRRFRVASDGVVGPAVASVSSNAAARAIRPVRPATDVAALTNIYAHAIAPSPAPSAPAAPASPAAPAPTFNSLFSDQDRRAAIDPMVAALWSVPANAPVSTGPSSNAPAPQPAPASGAGNIAPSFDLFRDPRPDARPLSSGSS
jgi:hypothetical protein